MHKKVKTEILVFLIILAVASFFRLYKLDSPPDARLPDEQGRAGIPPGLYPDEAMNGNNALTALDTGQYKVFYPDNNGREGLFINIQAMSLKIFGIHPWSLRLVSAVIGILTVAGLYLLAKEVFGWRQAALASFMMAISSWHVIFSRIGFRAIMVPFVLVFGFYFFWKGLKKTDFISFGLAGLFWGLGAHTYISFRVAPLILLVVLAVYWMSIKKDFSLSKYRYTKARLIFGLIIFLAVAVLVAFPIIVFYLQHPDSFLGRTSAGLSVFAQEHPMKELGMSIVRTLGMFNFAGDYNWRHNISKWPQLSLPIGLLFVLGFFRELYHLAKREHKHISTTHAFLFAWFFVMLIPGFLSIEAPHAIRTMGALPVIMIFAAQGLYWLFSKFYRWHSMYNPHADIRESRILVVVALVAFLTSVGFLEYHRYFQVWGQNKETAGAFSQKYVELANKLNASCEEDINIKKYVLVNAGGVLVNGIPMPSQTVMFLTDTFTLEKQAAKNLFYLAEQQYDNGNYDGDSLLYSLEPLE